MEEWHNPHQTVVDMGFHPNATSIHQRHQLLGDPPTAAQRGGTAPKAKAKASPKASPKAAARGRMQVEQVDLWVEVV